MNQDVDKVKTIVELDDNESLLISEVAQLYETSVKKIKHKLWRHSEEFDEDPESKVLSRESILLLGMVLNHNRVAHKIRDYLMIFG